MTLHAGAALAQGDSCSRFRGVKSWQLSFTADVDHEGVSHKPGTPRFRASGAGTLAPRAEAEGYVWAGTLRGCPVDC